MICLYKLKCDSKVRRMIEVAQSCQEGSNRDKFIEHGMLQCLCDKAGMWTAIAGAGRAHGTARFEINLKWDTRLVSIEVNCFDSCIRRESNNQVMVNLTRLVALVCFCVVCPYTVGMSTLILHLVNTAVFATSLNLWSLLMQ